jgi:hypothetical protein
VTATAAQAKLSQPIELTAVSGNTETGHVTVGEDRILPAFEVHQIHEPSENWAEAGYRWKESLWPVIELQGLSASLKNPSVSDGQHTLTYQGDLSIGRRLVISSPGKARLYAAELVVRPAEGRQDPKDPTGFRMFTQGYEVAVHSLEVAVQGGEKYRVRVAGKAERGANSLVGLRGRTAAGQLWETELLQDAFTDEWNDQVRAEVELPAGAVRLDQVVLYRHNRKGRIWYGPVSLQRADLPEEGLDASGQLIGQHLVLHSGTFTTITARFQEFLPGFGPKLRVQLRRDAR